MPGFHVLDYNNAAAGINDVNVDMTASTDGEFTQDGSGHYRFTEDYMLFGAVMFGASVLRARFQMPHWNALGEFEVFAANRSLAPPANPLVDWYIDRPIPIPQMESLQVQDSNNLGASTEIENVVLFIRAADGFWPIPGAGYPMKTRATVTFTPLLNAWSGGQAITFTAALRGGVYAVVGAVLQGGNCCAFRILFPRYRLTNNRKFRPGGIPQNAAGNNTERLSQIKPGAFGEWGRFATWEPPLLEVFGTAASSTAFVLYLDLIYLGDSPALLNAGSAGG